MNQTKAHTFIVYRCPVCHEFKSMQGSPRCHNVAHEPVEVAPLARVAELEAALHTIANSTYNVQYETAQPPAVVRYASYIHGVARAALEPPVTRCD